MEQSFFNYDLRPNFSMNDYFVGTSNNEAYNLLINTKNRNLLLSKTSEIREYIIKQKKSNIRWSIDIDPVDLY